MKKQAKRKSRKPTRAQKKSRAKKSSCTALERALLDRMLIGMGMRDQVDLQVGYVSAYILNPNVRGPAKLVVEEAATWPAFIGLLARADGFFMKRLGIEPPYELLPFWIGRFIAATEEDLLFGWTYTSSDRSDFHVKVLGLEYDLAESALGIPQMLRADRIPRSLVIDTLDVCFGILTRGLGGTYDIEQMQGIDSASVSDAFTAPGGEA